MSTDYKKELAGRLLEAKGEWSLQDQAHVPEKVDEMRRKVIGRQRNLYVELYAEFFSEDELIAELDFYESDIGKSIVQNRKMMNEEFQCRARRAFADLNEEFKSEIKGKGGYLQSFSRKWPPSDDR